MSKYIDYKVVLSKNQSDLYEKVNTLKKDGWKVDEIAAIEWVGDRPFDTYVEVLFKVVSE